MAITLPEFAERIINLPSGGFLTDENRFDRPYIYSLIHTAAAQAKRAEYGRTRKIHQAWYFPYIPEFNALAQTDGCLYSFRLPQQIAINASMTGLGYVGTLKLNTQFRVTIGRALFASNQTDYVMKVRSDKTDVLIENGYMEVYGKKPQQFRVEGIWADVTDCPNYNIEDDSYPIEASLIPEVEKIILQTDLIIITKSAVDKLQNKQDDSAVSQR